MACKVCNGIGAVKTEVDGATEFTSCPECYCEQCDGSRFIRGGDGRVASCPACVLSKQPDRSMAKAGIPTLYRHVNFDSYHTDFSSCSMHQKAAKVFAESFAKNLTAGSTGLLIHGSLGVGKTHLAIAVMKARMDMGFTARYYDGLSFVKLIQGTYGDRERGSLSEADVMDTAVACDVLVLDDLGAFKVTDDRSEIMANVLNTRYLESRVTVITTNFPFEREGVYSSSPMIYEERDEALKRKVQTLGDRVGDRVVSRLQQMCVPLYVTGPDMRETVLRARV